MNVLITDAFCSANRGDAAILDGILCGLRKRLPKATFRVTSHFPALTTRFHDVEAIFDQDVVAVQCAIDDADLVVGCGGSYLHDLYALNLHPRLATMHAAARAGKPFVVYAQSIGPLDSALSRTAARNALDSAAWILVRDAASERVVRSLGVRAPVELGVDAAVAGPLATVSLNMRPVLGVTVRGWHFPGGGDAAALQAQYEAEVAAACDAWAGRTGGKVRFLNNCTSLGGYAQDDRVVARRVARRMRVNAQVVEDEAISFAEVREQAGACDLFLGTRMHSLIFATTAGVPAVGIGYEQKTEEWLDQVGLPGQFRPIEDPQGLTTMVLRAWDERVANAATLKRTIPLLRAQAEAQLDQLARIAEGERPQVRSRPAGRASWNEETWRYDRPHRRLRAVADAVLSECSGTNPEGERARVLDLGCSSGLLGRMLGPRFDYVGLDVAPSVAADEPGFEVHTASLDAPWPVAGSFDVVVASGALEYVEDLGGVLRRARACLRTGGLAVLTLFNLAHVSRGPNASRHPTWRFADRPDDFVLRLRELGLTPTRVFVSSAGREPAQAVDAEGPTDLDRAGAVQLGLPEMCRLAHHLVVVCRAREPQLGIGAVAALGDAGRTLEAMQLAVSIVKADPWAARGWVDLGTLWYERGDLAQATTCLERASRLDPSRPGLAGALAALHAEADVGGAVAAG